MHGFFAAQLTIHKDEGALERGNQLSILILEFRVHSHTPHQDIEEGMHCYAAEGVDINTPPRDVPRPE